MAHKINSRLLIISAIMILSGLTLSIETRQKLAPPLLNLSFAKVTGLLGNAYASSWNSLSQGICGGVIHECPMRPFYCYGNDCDFYRDGMCWGMCQCHFSKDARQDSYSCYCYGCY